MAKNITIATLSPKQKSAIISLIKTALLGLADTKIKFGSPAERDAYPHWVDGQRRGLDKFVQRNPNTGKFAKDENGDIVLISAEEITNLFLGYMEKCNKKGIDPTNAPRAGRKKKVTATIETEEGKVTVSTEVAEGEDITEAVAEVVNEALEQSDNLAE